MKETAKQRTHPTLETEVGQEHWPERRQWVDLPGQMAGYVVQRRRLPWPTADGWPFRQQNEVVLAISWPQMTELKIQ